MAFASILAGVGLSLYVLLGSATWGYILLRIGWPNIRSIDLEYKSGASIAIGAFVSIMVVLVSAAIAFLNLADLGFEQLILVNTILIFLIAIAILTVKRKFMSTRKVNVGVPKRVVSANIAAKKAMEKLPENSYTKVNSMSEEKAERLRERLEEKIWPPEKIPDAVPVPNVLAAKKEEAKVTRSGKEDDKRQKTMEEIISRLEKKQAEEKSSVMETRNQSEKKVDESKEFIRQNLMKEVGLAEENRELGELAEKQKELEEKKDGTEAKEQAMPKSMKALKELLKEGEGNG